MSKAEAQRYRKYLQRVLAANPSAGTVTARAVFQRLHLYQEARRIKGSFHMRTLRHA